MIVTPTIVSRLCFKFVQVLYLVIIGSEFSTESIGWVGNSVDDSSKCNLWFAIVSPCSLRDPAQVEQLLRYIIEEPPEDAESKRTFKYAFVTEKFAAKELLLIISSLLLPSDHLSVT